MKKLTFDEIESIQESCTNAMELWGYRKMSEGDNSENFNPLADFAGF
jgi:hypothetical protein